MNLVPANATPMEQLLALDENIAFTCDQIDACKSLPPDKRALATTRMHYQLKLLEEARWTLAKQVFPEATKSFT